MTQLHVIQSNNTKIAMGDVNQRGTFHMIYFCPNIDISERVLSSVNMSRVHKSNLNIT